MQGYKITRHDPLHRILIGRVYHYFVKTMFGLGVRDTDCDFRLIRRTSLAKLDLVSDTGMICVEMMYKFKRAGWRFVEAPVHHFQRAHGKSQFFNFPRLFQTLWRLVRFWIEQVVLGGR